jgi:large subunit ribosomal protein L3
MNQLLARKIEMTQVFDEDGRVHPLTIVEVEPATVTKIKTVERDGYSAVQVGYGVMKPQHLTKPVAGQVKNLKTTPRRFREERRDDTAGIEVGQEVSLESVFAVGDLISVTGTSKGKGFQGGVKRWHFAGGPKTHGQSDRHRAPGSIGSGTDPGRVWKGLHMAGHMGSDKVTTRGLRVFSIEGNRIAIRGAVPGARQSLVMIKKQGS